MIAKLALLFLVGMALLALVKGRPRIGDGARRPRLFRRKTPGDD